jgi:hypothetical protein
VSSQRNRLEVRVENRYFEGTEITVPVATLLVDGEDLFSRSTPTGFVGFDPDQLLGTDQPLLPVEQARRVAVYRCSCSEPGCGVVAPVISRTDTEVRWTDFQDFTGWFDRPLSDDEPEDGRPLAISELTFETNQYTDEVRRAATDRSWETPTRKTARFLKEMLEDEFDALADLGLELDWVHPAHRREASVSLSLRDVDHRYVERPRGQLVMTLSAGPGTPNDRAAEMLANLLSKSPDQWMIAFPWEALQHD